MVKLIVPFIIKEMVGRNAIRLDLTTSVRTHLVVNVSHTTPYYKQPHELKESTGTPTGFAVSVEDSEKYVERILQHRKRGRIYQFLVKWKGKPTHEES